MDITSDYPDLLNETLYKEAKLVDFLSEEVRISNPESTTVTKTYLSDTKKVLLPGDFRYGHLVNDVLSAIVYELDKTKGKLHFIFSVGPKSRITNILGTNKVLEYVGNKLIKLGHTVTYSSQGEVENSVLVDNFVVHYKNIPHDPYTLSKVREFLLSGIEIPDANKKIYISRAKIANSSTSNSRMEKENVLEEYLRSIGFTVVYPEQFKNYEEQLVTLASAKILVAATGSSLISSIVMPPRSSVVEFSTPLSFLGSDKKSIAPYYYQVAAAFNLNYLSINSTAEGSEMVSYIESNPAIKSFLSLDYN